jgi:small-conductance mechanosensitive channel
MAKMDKRTIGALWLIIGPIGLLIATFFLYALLNWLTGTPINDTLSVLQVIANVSLFVIGLVSVIALLPGIIVGVILLVTRK